MCDRGRIASGAGTLNPGGLWGPGWDSLPSILKQRTREDPWAGRLSLVPTWSTRVLLFSVVSRAIPSYKDAWS